MSNSDESYLTKVKCRMAHDKEKKKKKKYTWARLIATSAHVNIMQYQFEREFQAKKESTAHGQTRLHDDKL